GLYLSRAVPEGATFTAADLREAQQGLNHFFTGLAPAPLRGQVAMAYAHGLFVEKFTDHGTVVAHSGGYPGFTTYMCWHEESGYTVIASANGTHSSVAAPARRVLLPLVAASKGGAKVTAETWPETLAAAARIAELVRAVASSSPGELAARYADLFAENVEMDFPLVRRIEYLQQALVNLGQLQSDEGAPTPKSERPSCRRWSMKADFGRLELYIELAPVAPFGVQTVTADAVNGWSKVNLF